VGVTTEILPVVAPAGIVAVIWVPDITVKLAGVPLKSTLVAPGEIATQDRDDAALRARSRHCGKQMRRGPLTN
jgi:hypothetical protein